MFGITLKHREEVSLDEARTRLRLEIEKRLIERCRFDPKRFASHTSPMTIEELASQNSLRVIESIDAGRMNYVSDLVAGALEAVGLPPSFEALTHLRKFKNEERLQGRAMMDEAAGDAVRDAEPRLARALNPAI